LHSKKLSILCLHIISLVLLKSVAKGYDGASNMQWNLNGLKTLIS
jgi:hypothetical protein